MTFGGSGFGVLEWKEPSSGVVKLAYLSPLPKDAKFPSQLDNRLWEFYEIENPQSWTRIEDPWGDGRLESGLILAHTAHRLVLKRIIKVPTGEVCSYTYNLVGTQLKFPDCDEQLHINGRTIGMQLFFDTGDDHPLPCLKDWEPYD